MKRPSPAMSRYVAMLDILREAGKVLWLFGPPGVGKTSFINFYARLRGMHPIIFPMSTAERVDVLGLPNIVKYGNHDVSHATTPKWIIEAEEHDGPVLVFGDEVTLADGELQGAFLKVINERIMPNGDKVPDNVTFVLAGNQPSSINNGYDLSSALVSRITSVDFDVPLAEWLDGFVTKFSDPLGDGSADTLSTLTDRATQVRAMMAGFLFNYPDMGNTMEVEEPNTAFATRRTWDDLADILSHGHKGLDDDPELKRVLVLGTIGPKAGNAFLAHMALNSDTPTLESVLDDLALLQGLESHALFQLTTMMVTAMDSRPDDDRLWKMFYSVIEMRDDIAAVFALRVIRKAKKDRMPELVSHIGGSDINRFLPSSYA